MANTDSDPPLNFWSILVYIWIFCLYMIIFKSIGTIIIIIINISPLKDFKDSTIGYDSPIFWNICVIYDYLLSSWVAMIIYAVLLVAITFVFLILWVFYHFFKMLGMLAGNLHKKTPFPEVMNIIKMIDREKSAQIVLKYYREELIKILLKTKILKSLEELNYTGTENFTNNTIETFVFSQKSDEYINEDLTVELKDKYEDENFYYIDAFRHNSHKKQAMIYKNMKILTPSMDEAAINSRNGENVQEFTNINLAYITNLNNIK